MSLALWHALDSVHDSDLGGFEAHPGPPLTCRIMIGHEYLHTECCQKNPKFRFSDRGRVFGTFALRTNTSANRNGCGEQMSRLPSNNMSNSVAWFAVLTLEQTAVSSSGDTNQEVEVLVEVCGRSGSWMR